MCIYQIQFRCLCINISTKCFGHKRNAITKYVRTSVKHIHFSSMDNHFIAISIETYSVTVSKATVRIVSTLI